MITALFAAGLAAVTPTPSDQPAAAVAGQRCLTQHVMLPAGKIGPTTTILRCKTITEVASRETPRTADNAPVRRAD